MIEVEWSIQRLKREVRGKGGPAVESQGSERTP